MNYFPFNVGDYAAHTGHLEPMEDLAYRRLLDQYYLREEPIPADTEAAAKLVRMRSMKADVESVLKEFFTLTDEGWRHSRCDAEIEKMQDKQAKARASGLASANARSKAQQASVERALASVQTDAERSLGTDSTGVQLPTPTPTPTPTPRKEKTMVAPPDGVPTEPVALPLKAKDLAAEGVDRQLAADWLALRKAKRLPLTPTAWADTKSEGLKAGLDASQTVAKAVANNWAGFKSSWLLRDAATHKAVNGADVFDGVH